MCEVRKQEYLNSVQVHFLYQTILVQRPRQVPLVAEHQDGDPGQLRSVQKVVELVTTCLAERRSELFGSALTQVIR